MSQRPRNESAGMGANLSRAALSQPTQYKDEQFLKSNP